MNEKKTDDLSLSSTFTTKTMAENDLGLHERIPERDIEQTMDDIEKGSPLKPVESSVSRKSFDPTMTLSRVLSRVRTSDTLEAGPPPDGGLHAWMQAVLGHLLILTTWGFINSFGLFQTYYVDNMKIGSASAVSWIGTVQAFVLFGLGCFSGRALDAGFFRLTFVTGATIAIFGMFMLSLCNQYWQIFLAQGICVGIGFGMMFVPSIALVSTYFLKNRSGALGVMVTGATVGGLVFPAIAEECLPSLGFGWTVRIMAFIQLACLVLCGLFFKPRLPPRKTGPIVEWAAFRELPYMLYLMCGFFFFWAIYIGFFYVSSYARNVLGGSQSLSFNLLLALNGVSIVGRLAVNFLATYTGPINMLWPFIVATAAIGYGWIAVHNFTGLWIFACIYGITASALQGLWPVVLASLTTDPKKAGVRAGMGFTWIGFAALTGSPIGGALIEMMHGDYLGCQLFTGTCMVISAAFLGATRWAVLRQQGKQWKWVVKV